MYFESLAALWDMDGHGIYVWLAYLLTACPIAVMVWLPIKRLRQHWRWIEAELRRSGTDVEGQRASLRDSASCTQFENNVLSLSA